MFSSIVFCIRPVGILYCYKVSDELLKMTLEEYSPLK